MSTPNGVHSAFATEAKSPSIDKTKENGVVRKCKIRVLVNVRDAIRDARRDVSCDVIGRHSVRLDCQRGLRQRRTARGAMCRGT